MSNPRARSFGMLDVLRWGPLLAAGAAPAWAQAQAWYVQPVVSANVTATSNAGYTGVGARQSDTIINVSPGLVVHGVGPRLTVDGAFYFDAVDYVNGSQRNTVLPHGALNTNTTLIERTLFLDASLAAFQTSTTPFAARPTGSSTYNTDTTTQARFNPAIKHDFTPEWSIDAYDNNTWLHTSNQSGTASGNPRDNAYVQDGFVSIARKPVPFGAELQFNHQDTQYANQGTSALTIDKWRGILSYAFYEQLSVGLIGGYEHDSVPYGSVNDSSYGVNAKWQPTERTKMDATVEHRFFGVGWDAEFEHRMPFQAWTLHLTRTASTYASSLGSLPVGDVDKGLGDILTTRYPDPVERARVVQDTKAALGLPTTLGSAVDIYTTAAQLEQSATLAYLITGVRDAVAFSYYFQKLGPLPIPGTPAVVQALTAPDNSQHGVAVQYSHRLNPLATVTAQGRWSRMEGVFNNVNDGSSKDKVYRIGLDWKLAQQSTGSIGLRWQQHRSNVSADAEETALIVGLDHRF